MSNCDKEYEEKMWVYWKIIMIWFCSAIKQMHEEKFFWFWYRNPKRKIDRVIKVYIYMTYLECSVFSFNRTTHSSRKQKRIIWKRSILDNGSVISFSFRLLEKPKWCCQGSDVIYTTEVTSAKTTEVTSSKQKTGSYGTCHPFFAKKYVYITMPYKAL